MRVIVLAVALALSLVLPLHAAVAQDHEMKASPFDGLRWNGKVPEVEVAGTWYRPVTIDGVTVADILESCETRWPGKREKRFGEDLVEVLVLLGHTPGRTVTLELVQLSDSRAVTLDGVTLTAAKRAAIRNPGRDPRSATAAPKSVKRADAIYDLGAFGSRLQDQFAYYELRGVDLEAGLRSIADSLDDTVDTEALARSLHELLMRFGDGHARVESSLAARPAAWLGCLLETAGGGIVALRSDRSAWVDDERPFVQAIDGVPLDRWLAAVQPGIVDGSEAVRLHRGVRALHDIDGARRGLGEPDALARLGKAVELTLSNKPEGGRTAAVTVGLARKRPVHVGWPRSRTRTLTGKDAARVKGGVGVLRIPVMDDDLIPALRDAMDTFQGTGGLIVDVRGNWGGRRGLLMALAGYLIGPNEPPVVGNAAAYRLSRRFKHDHLGGSRHMYRATDEHWTETQREAIASFAEGFAPEWKLPDGFSEWHYLVMDRTGNEREYFYDRPVVVLSDAGCFSATDIFLAALKELPRVTILGTPSGGGSARSQAFTLPRSRIEVVCASMASFQPNGRLYDGNGVEVDVTVERDPADLLPSGGDAQLAAAVRHVAR